MIKRRGFVAALLGVPLVGKLGGWDQRIIQPASVHFQAQYAWNVGIDSSEADAFVIVTDTPYPNYQRRIEELIRQRIKEAESMRRQFKTSLYSQGQSDVGIWTQVGKIVTVSGQIKI